MSFARFINRIFKKPILNEWEKCKFCEYSRCIGNHSPCYECKGNDKYKERREMENETT